MTGSTASKNRPTVAVIGAGLAGMAAATAARQNGLDVELFEARRALGGRAGSFRDRTSGRQIDLCQHVAMGCCTNLIDFCRRMGVDHLFQRQRRVHFIGPDQAQYTLAASPLLPAPLHLMPGLLGLGYLTRAERWQISRALLRLARCRSAGEDNSATIGTWLREQGQSDQAIGRFWSVVLESALSETLDRASLAAAQKVFVDGFLAARQAYELLVPTEPLGEIFDRLAGEQLARQGVRVHRSVRVRQIEVDGCRPRAVLLPDGSRVACDFLVAAVPWQRIRAILPREMLDVMPELDGVGQIEAAPITAVHLWLDRPLTRLPNAALVGRLGQWLFRPPSRAAASENAEHGYYHQVVISASHGLVGRPSAEVASEIVQELRAVWPDADETRLLRSRVVTIPSAVFSVRPGLDAMRPEQATSRDNFSLAGDWTATGWPATMEGAVRSGYRAVEAILAGLGRDEPIRVPDLPRGLLARWLIGPD